MPRPLKRPATYEDLLQVPDHLVAEILDGELVTTPRPALPHAQTYAALVAQLHGPFAGGRGGPGGWWILAEPELHLQRDIVVPDLAGWRRETLPAIPDAAFITVAPDWVCEILSPSTERIDRLRKLRIYARERVKWTWLVNPIQRTLEVYELLHQHWTLTATHGGEDAVSAEPFEAVPLELARIWPAPSEVRQVEGPAAT